MGTTKNEMFEYSNQVLKKVIEKTEYWIKCGDDEKSPTHLKSQYNTLSQLGYNIIIRIDEIRNNYNKLIIHQENVIDKLSFIDGLEGVELDNITLKTREFTEDERAKIDYLTSLPIEQFLEILDKELDDFNTFQKRVDDYLKQQTEDLKETNQLLQIYYDLSFELPLSIVSTAFDDKKDWKKVIEEVKFFLVSQLIPSKIVEIKDFVSKIAKILSEELQRKELLDAMNDFDRKLELKKEKLSFSLKYLNETNLFFQRLIENNNTYDN